MLSFYPTNDLFNSSLDYYVIIVLCWPWGIIYSSEPRSRLDESVQEKSWKLVIQGLFSAICPQRHSFYEQCIFALSWEYLAHYSLFSQQAKEKTFFPFREREMLEKIKSVTSEKVRVLFWYSFHHEKFKPELTRKPENFKFFSIFDRWIKKIENCSTVRRQNSVLFFFAKFRQKYAILAFSGLFLIFS